jgi:protein-tyrosine phosphatase
MPLEPKKIASRIYQGGWILSYDIPVLSQLGITDILNLDLPYDDPQPFIEAGFILHTVPLIDNCLMLPQQVRDIMAVIDNCLSLPPNKIYIHCVEGVSRSVTISWLYLIHSGTPPSEAGKHVHPNPLLYNDAIVDGLAVDASL